MLMLLMTVCSFDINNDVVILVRTDLTLNQYLLSASYSRKITIQSKKAEAITPLYHTFNFKLFEEDSVQWLTRKLNINQNDTLGSITLDIWPIPSQKSQKSQKKRTNKKSKRHCKLTGHK